jgi:integrase
VSRLGECTPKCCSIGRQHLTVLILDGLSPFQPPGTTLGLNVKAPKPDKKEAAYIPLEKVTDPCDAITGDWLAPLFYLALATGFRRGELCALKWDDIDWTRPALRVDETTQELPEAKGGVRYDTPKSQKNRRTVVLPQNAVEVLQAHRRTQAALRMKVGAARLGGTFVFTTEKGTPLRSSTVSNHWRLIRKRVGVPGAEDVTLHGLRHTHATVLLQTAFSPRLSWSALATQPSPSAWTSTPT